MPFRKLDGRARLAPVASTLATLVALGTAWVADDAYITLRTADNFMHGYGLRWNVAERVQAYTHPLWLGLITAAYSVTREPYFTVIALSIVLAVVAIHLLVRLVAVDVAAAIAAVLVLGLSKAFVDYATSGLETPLTYLLLVAFFIPYFRPLARFRLQSLALVAALLALTDATAVWLVLPAIAVTAWRDGWRRSIVPIVFGLWPVLIWEAFSVIYYGSLLPNPTYARLLSGMPHARIVKHGLVYLLDSVNLDPFTLGAIAFAGVLAFTDRIRGARPVAIGMAAYLAAVVWMGGDVLSGKLLAAPLLCASVVISQLELATWPTSRRVELATIAAVLGLMAARPMFSNVPMSRLPIVSETSGIVDARMRAYPRTGLLNARRESPWPEEPDVEGGRRPRSTEPDVRVMATGGLAGFYAGPLVHIVNSTGVGDPLLARIPAARPWGMGVPRRDLPPGYGETLNSGLPQVADPQLAELYARLSLVARGPIWSAPRWRAIASLVAP